MKKQQRRGQIQKKTPLTFERVLDLARRLTPDEKVAAVKAIAVTLGQPLYTASEVQQIVNRALAQRQQPSLSQYAEEIRKLTVRA